MTNKLLLFLVTMAYNIQIGIEIINLVIYFINIQIELQFQNGAIIFHISFFFLIKNQFVLLICSNTPHLGVKLTKKRRKYIICMNFCNLNKNFFIKKLPPGIEINYRKTYKKIIAVDYKNSTLLYSNSCILYSLHKYITN